MLHSLTNEKLKHKFLSNFDLVLYAIHIAKTNIKEGNPSTLAELVEDLVALPNMEIPFSKVQGKTS